MTTEIRQRYLWRIRQVADSGREDNPGDKNGSDEPADGAAGDTIRILPVSWDDDSGRRASAESQVPPAAPERAEPHVPPAAAERETSVPPATPQPRAQPVPPPATPRWIMWSAVAGAALVGIAVLVGAGLYLFGGSGQAVGPGTAAQGATYTVPDPQSGLPQPGGAVVPPATPSPGAAAGVTAGETSAAAGASASQGATDETSCGDNLAQIDTVIQDYYKAKGAWPVTMGEAQSYASVTPRCPTDDRAYYYNPYTHEVTCPNGHTPTKQGSTVSP